MFTRPWTGIIALLTTYLAQPLCHSLSSLIKDAFGAASPLAFVAVGIVGLAIIALALKSEEGPATAAGLVGGLLTWTGFVDGEVAFMAAWFNVPRIQTGAGFEMSGKFAVLMSSVIFLVPLFFLYGLTNRESKCSLMRFIFRTSHASPGDPTPGLRRSFARLTALETIFVKWAVYLFALWVNGPFATAIWGVVSAWLIYLAWKLVQLPRLAYAFRYAIPLATFLWSLTEVGAARGSFSAIWLQPGEHPITMTTALLACIAGLLCLVSRWRPRAVSGSVIGA